MMKKPVSIYRDGFFTDKFMLSVVNLKQINTASDEDNRRLKTI